MTLFNSKSKGFIVAKGSSVPASDLLESGIFLKDFKFHPHNIETIENLIWKAFREGRISTNYYISDKSTSLKRIYQFKKCPF